MAGGSGLGGRPGRQPEGVPRVARDPENRLTFTARTGRMPPMGYVDVAGVGFVLPDGRELFADVSFRVGEGAKVALVGPNGAGKTTLLRVVAGDLPTPVGGIVRSGGLGVMRQFIGMIGDDRTLEDLALSLVEPALGAAGERLAAAAAALDETERSQIAYANALAHWGEVCG